MARLGFDRFAVVGHDRGGRVAYRLALDHPDRVTRLAVLDIVPTLETWARMDRRASLGSYHWLFLAQPPDLPERLIGADPAYFLRWTLESWAGRPDAFDARALAEYHRAFRDPAVIHATCEDYRAGATVDVEADAADRGHRRIACPVLALWGEQRPQSADWDPVAIWRDWATTSRAGAPLRPFPAGGGAGRDPGRPRVVPPRLALVLPPLPAPDVSHRRAARCLKGQDQGQGKRRPTMMTAAVAILTMSSPILLILGLLELAAWRDRRREAMVARQIRLTDALADEMGPGRGAPRVQAARPVRGGWRSRFPSAGRPWSAASWPSLTTS